MLDFTITLVSALATIPVALLLLGLAAEAFAAVFSQARPVMAAQSRRPRVAFLIPAHNEESGISHTLANVVSEMQAGDRCLVVADNCADKTAEIVRGFSVEVLERVDAERRGKGYALDAGVRHLRADPPEILVFIDADCTIVPGSIELLAKATSSAGRPTQAGDDLQPPADAGLRDRVSSFAFLFKNHVRPLGLNRLGGPSPLFGTGFALPWNLVDSVQFASGNNVEDLQLGIDLAIAGRPAQYCPVPCVLGRLPGAGSEAVAQRRRWEHGHIRTLSRQAPRLLWQAIVQRRPSLLAMAWDLAIPPLSFMAILGFVLTVALILSWLATGDATWLIALLIAEVVAGCSIAAAWARFGRDRLSLGDFVRLPWYVACKLPIYAALLSGADREWSSKQNLPTK